MVEVLSAHPWHVGILLVLLVVLIVAEIAARRWRREQQKPIKVQWHKREDDRHG